MRVNSQNFFQLIYFCVCVMMVVFSFSAQVKASDLQRLKQQAEQGNTASQYYLAKLYSDGSSTELNPMLAYVWFSLAAMQKYEDAETQRDIAYSQLHKNHKPTAKALVDQYYQKYVVPFIPPFEINLNGEKITRSVDVSPEAPIYAIFKHTDPDVKYVRMHYPKKPSRFKTFEMGRPHRILNHEKFMKAGRKSRSVFTAIGADGKAYNQIVLTFIPVSEKPVSEEPAKKDEAAKEPENKEKVEQKEDENSQ